MAARLAAKWGYKNIGVFHAGVPAWARAGQPLLVTREFVKNRLGYIVLIDTRGVAAAKKGHIQGAVAIALKKIAGERNQFPVDRKAHIVFYGNSTDLKGISLAIKQVARWGYSNLLVMQGGYQEWLKHKGPIQKGSVRTKIVYFPRPHPGEISGDEFMNIVRNRGAGVLILDVRTKAETAGGMLPGAINIPVDSLQANLSKLPRDKEIVTHCVTGLRAEMAYNILRNAKFNARFLNDKVAILRNRIFCCYK